MHACHLFPLVVEDYKKHLREDIHPHKSFASFCQSRLVRTQGVQQWLRRRGLNVETLRYEALLEKCGTDKEAVLAHLRSSAVCKVLPDKVKGSSSLPLEKRIKGVGITFPDGVQVHIRETTPAALGSFIKSYNKLIDLADVRAQ